MATTWQPIGPNFNLPVVGGDDGTWGEKLNAALTKQFVELGHDVSAGTLSFKTKGGEVVTINLPIPTGGSLIPDPDHTGFFILSEGA